MSTDYVKMDTGIPLFFPEIQYLLLETIPLETIMRVLLKKPECKAGHTLDITLAYFCSGKFEL